jgi:CRISPR-associated protein Csm3
MRIGGSSTTMDIGSVNNNVIKTIDGEPYIPGSSLKGKLRSLYALSKGWKTIPEEDEDSKKVFGYPVDKNNKESENKDKYLITRLIVRDSYLKKSSVKQTDFLENKFTEIKWENTINRKDSKATPRQMERVPKGAKFKFSFIYSIFNKQDVENLNIVIKALKLLEDDFLGGSGSRGYGEVKVHIGANCLKTIEDYHYNKKPRLKHKMNLQANNDELINELKEKIKIHDTSK